MEGELKCPSCLNFYVKSVLLSCSHNLCSGCANNLQDSMDKFLPQSDESNSDQGDYPEIDKLSIVSETDSGVVCNSRPSSYISIPSIHNLFLSSTYLSQGCGYGIKCPVCKKITYLGESGFHSLPRNRVLDIIVEKFTDSNKDDNVIRKCELCIGDEPKEATVVCEQCEVFYCSTCRENCHPARGPLAKHNLVDPVQGKALLYAKLKQKNQKCFEHTEELLSLYCLTCKIPMCTSCHQDGPHINHESQAISSMCKLHKTDLSQTLQALSEKAKAETEFIQKLKIMIERIPANCVEFEAIVVAQCDALVEAIHQRKQELLDFVNVERDMKIKILKDQAHSCTSHLQKTTSLLYFCVEVLKESDPASFLQISSSLLNRVTLIDQNFFKEIQLVPGVSAEFELTLDNTPVLHSIQTMNFFEMKAPGQPAILPEECSAENNSVTVAWQPYPGSVVDAYTLELDDGNGGNYRVVYIGPELMCTVDGLHFNSIYNARVKCQNHTGESDYSESISLQTAEVAWFSLDPDSAHPDIIISNDNLTATCSSFEHRIILGGIGFSKGVHYWEVTIDRYDSNTDPAVGIARFDVSKNYMLGKDDKGWCMYVDNKRSWFLHSDIHTDRTDGGICKSSVIGVLLDLDRHTLSFFINGEPQGPVAFTDLYGVYYPAVSINRNIQMTMHSGLNPPIVVDDDDD